MSTESFTRLPVVGRYEHWSQGLLKTTVKSPKKGSEPVSMRRMLCLGSVCLASLAAGAAQYRSTCLPPQPM